MRNLLLIYGNQLDFESAVFDDFDAKEDVLWMAEVDEEATHVWCHKLRIAYFFSAMRHFREECKEKGWTIQYHELRADARKDSGKSFQQILKADVRSLKPEKLITVEAGDYRVREQIRDTAKSLGIELETREDRHFYSSPEDFDKYADGRKQLTLEYFYRGLRKKHNILVSDKGQPEGGDWNYDKANRESFGRSGPKDLPKERTFRPDEITEEVIELVESRFSDHPGSLEKFTLPVTRKEALAYLRHFIKFKLPDFGKWEDAMWSDEPFLYHSRLSAPLNLQLLDPRECVEKAVEAYENGDAPLNSVEGYIRQILGWREFVRGIYWHKMPEYVELNALDHEEEMPQFFWDGDTEMNCVKQSMKHVINYGYSHHIQRLMVLGNFSQLWGVHPKKFHEWHMAMYLDAIDWVSLPNTLGMSQYGDGGIVGTKPYCSSGNYINKMSNFCKECKFNFKKRIGDDACPFTTLYWEFLDRHSNKLSDNRRMTFAYKNLEKIKDDAEQFDAILNRADELRKNWS